MRSVENRLAFLRPERHRQRTPHRQPPLPPQPRKMQHFRSSSAYSNCARNLRIFYPVEPTDNSQPSMQQISPALVSLLLWQDESTVMKKSFFIDSQLKYLPRSFSYIIVATCPPSSSRLEFLAEIFRTGRKGEDFRRTTNLACPIPATASKGTVYSRKTTLR